MSARLEEAGALRRLALFGTPLAVQVLPEAAQLNGPLLPAARAQAAAAPEAPGEAWRAAFAPEGEAAAALETLVARSVALAGAMAAAPADGWRRDVLLEVLRPGQGVAVTSLAEAVWCARYVLDDGGSGTRRDYGARFEAQDPRGVGPVMYAPHLSIADPSGPTLGISQTIGLKTGAILVYPGWLLHGLEIYRGPESFVSLLIRLRR